MRAGLRALLTGEATISTIVGSRVYITRAPQGAVYPHVLITQMGSEENLALDGTGPLRFLDIDIDCKATTGKGAADLAKAVRDFIKDYSGAAGGETIEAVILNGEVDGYEDPRDGSDVGTVMVTLDVTIQYVE